MSSFKECINFMGKYNKATKWSECKLLEQQLDTVFDVTEYDFGEYTIQTFLRLFSIFFKKMVLIRKPRYFFRIFKISEFYHQVHSHIQEKKPLNINKILKIEMKNKSINSFFMKLKSIFSIISSKLDEFWGSFATQFVKLSTTANSSLNIEVEILKKRIISILGVREEINSLDKNFNIHYRVSGICPKEESINNEKDYAKLVGYLKSLYESIPQIVEWTQYITINETVENNINKFNEFINKVSEKIREKHKSALMDALKGKK